MLFVSCLYYVFDNDPICNDKIKVKNVNAYGFSKCKGMKISCHNINRLESKFEEIKYNLLYSEK